MVPKDEEILINGKFYVSVGRASDLSGYHRDYLGRLCRGEKLDGRKIGNNWVVSQDDVKKLVAKNFQNNFKKNIYDIADSFRNNASGSHEADKCADSWDSSLLGSQNNDPAVLPIEAVGKVQNLKISFWNSWFEIFKKSALILGASAVAILILYRFPFSLNADLGAIERRAERMADYLRADVFLDASRLVSSGQRSALLFVNRFSDIVRNAEKAASLPDISLSGFASLAWPYIDVSVPSFPGQKSFYFFTQSVSDFVDRVHSGGVRIFLSYKDGAIAAKNKISSSIISYLDRVLDKTRGITVVIRDKFRGITQKPSIIPPEETGVPAAPSLPAGEAPSSIPSVPARLTTAEFTQLKNLVVADLRDKGLIVERTIEKPTIIERTLERIISGVSPQDLDEKLSILNNKILSQIVDLKNQLASRTQENFQAIALTNKIDQLSNITVSGVTGLTDADIPNGITASNYLLLSGGTLTGTLTGTNLTLSGDLNVAGTQTFSGALSVPYFSATSASHSSFINYSLAIGTSTPYAKLSVWGVGTTTDRTLEILNNASTTLLTVLDNGNVGIATTSPYAKLSVSGEIVAAYFTATTSIASQLPYASSTAITISDTASTTNLVVSNISTFKDLTATNATTTNATSTNLAVSGNFNVTGNTTLTNATTTNLAVTATASSTDLIISGNATLSKFTPNSVIFSSTGGLLSQNNANFSWDNSATRLSFPYASSTSLTTSGGVWFATNGGNVGIGTTSPFAKLSVHANATENNLNLFTIASSTAIATTTLFTVLNTGNVGIGTSTPAYSLDIYGTARMQSLISNSLILSNAYDSIITAAVGSSTGYTNFSGGIGTGGTNSIGGPFNNALRLTSTGNLVNIGSIQGGELNLTGGGTFAAKVDYTTGSGPRSVAIGDLNSDGKADLAVANYSPDTISVLLNNGNGAFATKVDYAAGSGPRHVSIGDLNGDGKADLAVANNFSGNTISILFNNGNGTFAAKVDYATTGNPSSVSIGDLNSDGKADLAVANYDAAFVSIFINNGNGTFAAKVDYATTDITPYFVSIGDLNGDGRADLAVANKDSTSISVFLNNGNGTFAAKVDYTTGAAPHSVGIGDMNNDGKADLVATNFSPDTISILLNNGNGTFATKVDYAAGSGPQSVSIGDLNGDGKADLAVANNFSGTAVSVFLNNGNGTFAAKVDYTTGASPYSVSMGDLNGDGKADLTVANKNSNSVSVFLNQAIPMFYAQASTGNVSIGTSTPWSKLSIQNTYGSQTPLFDIASSTSAAYATSSLFRINANGNVGIGTTAIGDVLPTGFNSDSGNAKVLEIRSASAGDIGLFLGRVDGTTTGLQIWHDYNTGDSYFDNRYNNDAGNIRFRTKTAGTPVDALTILGGGNVGIGTTTPGAILEVKVTGSNNEALKLDGNGIGNSNSVYVSFNDINGSRLGYVGDASGGNSDIYITSDYGNIQMSGTGGTCTLTGAASGGTCFSDAAFKNIQGSVTGVLNGLTSLQLKTFYWNDLAHQVTNASTTILNRGFIAQNVEQVFPEIVQTDENGYKKLDYGSLGLYAIQGIKELSTIIDVSRASTTISSVFIDVNGNVGIGTTTSSYKLHVTGDVAATGFVNLSTREAKKDIAFLGEADYDSALEKIKTTEVATYNYINDKDCNLSDIARPTNQTCQKRLGLIAEQAPVEILSPDHKGVDLYKMTAFLWSGVKAQQKLIDDLAARLDKVEGVLAAVDLSVASSSTPVSVSAISLDGILEILKTAGVYISNGVAQVQKLMATQVYADEVYTRQLCIEDVCINKTQLQALLRNAGLSETAPPTGQVGATVSSDPAISDTQALPQTSDATVSAMPTATSSAVIIDPAPAPVSDASASATDTGMASTTSTTISSADQPLTF